MRSVPSCCSRCGRSLGWCTSSALGSATSPGPASSTGAGTGGQDPAPARAPPSEDGRRLADPDPPIAPVPPVLPVPPVEELTGDQLTRYSRHLLLPGIGLEG